MAALVDDLAQADMIHASIRSALRFEVHRDLSAVEALWRGVESDPAVLATPYQRFDWVAAFCAGASAADAEHRAGAVRIVVLRDRAGRVRMILPLWCRREHGAVIARVVGAAHANFHMPLFASPEAAALAGPEVVEALRAAGAQAGIDAYLLGYQPRHWDGVANPLAQCSEPAPSNAYGLSLGTDADAEATVRRVFSADARKKLRGKEKKLVEAVGPIGFSVAATAEEARAILDAFYAQKAARLATIGVCDPYVVPGIRQFLARAVGAVPGLEDRTAIEVCALVARGDGRILATFAGAVDGRRYSGMMTSFDQDPALARFSPGDILLQHLVRYQAERGRRAFDLGVGEARYKASICDETIELREVAIPITLLGRLVTAQAVGRNRLKRRIKASPRLFRIFRRLGRLVRRPTDRAA
ncbi:GNAT family N-acetyltransferase [Methylobacterium sp. Leaf466]|uniref:GNAT family N-acetyltransferase n=1 Tax=Methylobacterium sp. Leaf466 TaxID=1736386 RepID=UPI0006FC6AE8|nr:GNAT family N-acetyltransferase [Methylobacterium sp. Leaf466]KQT88976.1 acyl-CoA acyltransferase [Methylobacterium sp. Leaf466]